MLVSLLCLPQVTVAVQLMFYSIIFSIIINVSRWLSAAPVTGESFIRSRMAKCGQSRLNHKDGLVLNSSWVRHKLEYSLCYCLKCTLPIPDGTCASPRTFSLHSLFHCIPWGKMLTHHKFLKKKAKKTLKFRKLLTLIHIFCTVTYLPPWSARGPLSIPRSTTSSVDNTDGDRDDLFCRLLLMTNLRTLRRGTNESPSKLDSSSSNPSNSWPCDNNPTNEFENVFATVEIQYWNTNIVASKNSQPIHTIRSI